MNVKLTYDTDSGRNLVPLAAQTDRFVAILPIRDEATAANVSRTWNLPFGLPSTAIGRFVAIWQCPGGSFSWNYWLPSRTIHISEAQ